MNRGTGGRLAWLPVFFLFGACSAFEADQEGAKAADGGAEAGMSSSGSSVSDAAAEAPGVVDAGTCLKIGPYDQPFTGGALGDWVNTPGATTTTFTHPATGGKAGDGSVLFSYGADPVNARRNVVEKALPSTARCFDLVVDFKPTVDARELVFTQVKFQNDHLIGLAIDTQYKVILGEQSSAAGGFNALAVSVVPITANEWHTANLRLELLSRSFTATVTLDGGNKFGSTNPILELDYTKSVEVGVSYVAATGDGQIEIDRVAFQ